MKSIVFTGGGTAGHIMPNIAIINQLKDYKIYYFGSNGMEKERGKIWPMDFLRKNTQRQAVKVRKFGNYAS